MKHFPVIITGAMLCATITTAQAAPGDCPDRRLWALAPNTSATFDEVHAGRGAYLIDDGDTYIPGDVVEALPARARITAFDTGPTGGIWFAVDTAITLGGEVYRPTDVIAYDDGVFSKTFDGHAHGLPDGLRIAALDHRFGLRLAFDRSFTHGDTLIRPVDVIRVDNDVLTREFDGSAAGVPATARIGALALQAPAQWRLAFTGAGSVGGTALTRMRVFAYDSDSASLSLDYDMATRSAQWASAGLASLALIDHPDHIFCFGFEAA